MSKNKKDIALQIAVTEGITRVMAGRIVDSVFEQIIQTVNDNTEVAIYGFGKFKPFTTAARDSRNLITGDAIKIPSKHVMKFYPSKTVKDLLNK